MRLRLAVFLTAVLWLADASSPAVHAQLVRRAEPLVETPTAPAMPPLPPPLPPIPDESPKLQPAPTTEPVTPPPSLPVKRAQPVDGDDGVPASPNIPAAQERPMQDVDQLKAAKAIPVEDDKPVPADPSAMDASEKKADGDSKADEKDKAKDKEKKAKAKPAEPLVPADPPEEVLPSELTSLGSEERRKELDASWKTLKDARTIKLEIPGPRGQIVDRNGVCLARNRLAYYLAMTFPSFEASSDAKVLAYARERLATAGKQLGRTWELTDKQILDHYKDRRWLPLVFTSDGNNGVELSEDDIKKIKPLLGKGLVVHPTYVRWYPKLGTACHILGYTGIVRKLPTGPIIDGEPFTEEPMGRGGLELSFENDLRGRPGALSILFSPDGSKLHQEWTRRPVAGYNLVTTLDYDMQRFAEDALRDHAKNGGAMVIMDVRNGDILAMASNPGYNLNEFVPRVPTAKFEQLLKDPKTPLVGRAFQGTYYPASTFKIMTALAGLESGTITPDTSFECSGGYQIGDRVFHNWTSNNEGSLTVTGAIKRSCNTWFYQAAMQIGAANITNMAERMGFGQPTGIPLSGEAKGFLPTDAYYMQRDGHKISSGMLASIAIGQVVTATPLQVAQGMCAVADGVNMPKVRLVKQVQDYNDNVVQAWPPDVRKQVSLKPEARETVLKGMIAVVQGEGGTGHNAQIKGVTVAGKTGTAQRQIFEDSSKNTWLAWFTGFLPARNPVYAFAVVYEGSPGEHVSGGSIAAPIVSDVFEKIYRNAKASDPLLIAAQDAPKAERVEEENTETSTESAPKARAVKEEPPPPPAQKPSVGGFFRRLFGGKN